MAEKTVEVKEVSTGKTRLFRKREPILVMTPQAVLDSCEDAPISVSIMPMTHAEAEKRDRLKKKIPIAKRIANQKAGISVKEVSNFNKEYVSMERSRAIEQSELLIALTDIEKTEYESAKLQDDAMSSFEKTKEDLDKAYLATLEKFQEKWSSFQEKSDVRDMDHMEKHEEAEDNLLLNSARCISANCLELNYEDGRVVEVNNDSIDEIHPDLFYWILTNIENESYLTNGEVLGFQ